MNKRSLSSWISHSKHRGRTLGRILLVLLGVLIAGIGALAFLDIGGDFAAGAAKDSVREQLGMTLSINSTSGNPIRGYTFNEVSLSSGAKQERRIFSAQTLKASVNFFSLLRGAPRLSNLTVGGVGMDLDRLVEELGKIRFPESSGGGDIPIDRVGLQDSRFTSKWGAIDVTELTAAIRGSLLDISANGAVNGVPVKGSAGVGILPDAIDVGKTELQVGKGLLTANGRIGLEDQTLDLQGSVKGLDISEITAFWPDFLASKDYIGNADIDVSASGSFTDPVISAKLGFKGSKVGGYPVENLSALLKYSGLRLMADNVKATTLGIPIEGQIAMAMRLGEVASVMVKLAGKNAPLSELAQYYPDIGHVEGSIERFAANIQGPTNALSGTIDLSAPAIVLMGKKIGNLAVGVKLAKSDTASVNGKFLLEGAQASVQGSIAKILTGANLNLTAKLLNLDIKRVEDLIPDGKKYALSGAVTANLAIRGRPVSPSVNGTVSSPKFTASGYTLNKPSLSFVYEKDTFSLKESSGTWNGSPIKASGTVGPLSSASPAINMTAQLAFNPRDLKQFVPDIDSYKLQGTIHAGVKLTGKLPEPRVDLVASSQALSAFGGEVSVKNLEVTTALAGDLTKLDKMDVALKAGSVSAGGIGLKSLSAAIRKDGSQVKLENVSAQSGEGTVTGGGLIDTGAKDPQLNLAFDLHQLDLAPLAQSGGLGVALAGKLSGRAELKGPASNPAISFVGQAPSFAVEGMTLTGLSANVSGNMNALKINELKANAGGAPLSATGDVSLADPFKANIEVLGKGLDLAALTEGIPDMKGQVSGKADLDFRVTSTARGNNGTGAIRSAAVTAYGIKTSNISLPLTLNGDSLKSDGGTLDLYGGKVTNNLTFDLKNMKFSDTLKASGVDVNSLAQDATGGLKGKIMGKAELSMKIDGNAVKTLAYSGSGQFSMGAGAITGFSGLNILSRLYGVDGIRYTKVTAPLRLTTGKLLIGKGSSAVPPANDPIYKSAALVEDGTFTFDKKLYFVADGKVNFQLINALTGGAAGGAEALLKGGSIRNIFSSGNLESALKNAVSSARKEGQDVDFRDVTAKVTGTSEKPSVSLVKVGASTKPQQPQQKPSDKTPQAPGQAVKEQTPQEAVKEQVEKKIEDGIQKGLDSLLDLF